NFLTSPAKERSPAARACAARASRAAVNSAGGRPYSSSATDSTVSATTPWITDSAVGVDEVQGVIRPVAAVDHADPDVPVVAVQDVRAVLGGVHVGLEQHARSVLRADSDVLAEGAPVVRAVPFDLPLESGVVLQVAT